MKGFKIGDKVKGLDNPQIELGIIAGFLEGEDCVVVDVIQEGFSGHDGLDAGLVDDNGLKIVDLAGKTTYWFIYFEDLVNLGSTL